MQAAKNSVTTPHCLDNCRFQLHIRILLWEYSFNEYSHILSHTILLLLILLTSNGITQIPTNISNGHSPSQHATLSSTKVIYLVYRQVDFSNNLASKFLISALSSVAVATATSHSSALQLKKSSCVNIAET